MAEKMFQKSQYDTPWKASLDAMFPRFLAFFFPHIDADIDWSKPVVRLNSELQQETANASVGRRFVDHLVQVHLRSGDKRIILIHTEIQCQRDDQIQDRLLTYMARIKSVHGIWPVTLLVLGDDQRNWRVGPILIHVWDYRLSIHIPTVKILDLDLTEVELEASDNPFAVIALAHRRARQTKGNLDLRCQLKKELVFMMLSKNYTANEIFRTTNFLDFVMPLPHIEDDRIWQDAKVEFAHMEYLAPVWNMFREDGKAEGEAKGMAQILLVLLARKFGELPDEVVSRVKSAKPEQLTVWADRILDEDRLERVLD